jgi:hypothetical protein
VGLANVVSIGEPELIIRRFQIKYKTGMTISVRMVELTMPPIIGAAIRFITSAPVPVDLLAFEYSGPQDAQSRPPTPHSTPCYMTVNLS